MRLRLIFPDKTGSTWTPAVMELIQKFKRAYLVDVIHFEEKQQTNYILELDKPETFTKYIAFIEYALKDRLTWTIRGNTITYEYIAKGDNNES